ncbi:hypothetical protein [Mycolicibacterium sp. 050158]|uniref:hypothetical protein n=1 Tax=Mycolicibacterium sp. 050158 TaxID=3090602 RepID=UPI00299E6F86|nr:hypothetical protein [Mycolicibacterium sp. 050158]MDX1889984.1 hypothetical protein [Mycolicibacterium sp. 050158]
MGSARRLALRIAPIRFDPTDFRQTRAEETLLNSPLTSHVARTSVAALAALALVGVAGCTPTNSGGSGSASTSPPTLPTIPFTSTTTSSAASEPADYRPLLLSAADLTDADDTFTERSRDSQPNGTAGASAFFVNDKDTRAITDTFMVYPDAATATATLEKAVANLPTLVAGGTPTPLAVGSDGVMAKGTRPNEDKAVTLAFFTEGRALVRLEFQSATGDPTTERFVTNVAKMQDIALRVGLAAPQ